MSDLIIGGVNCAKLKCSEMCLLLPRWNDQTRKEVTASIEKHGLFDPILLWRGEILDGRGRFEACLDILKRRPELRDHIKMRFTVWKPDQRNPAPEEVQAAIKVMVENLHRRQEITASERAMIAANLIVVANKGGRPRKDRENPNEKPVRSPTGFASQGEAADAAGVSRQMMNDAVKATKKCHPEIKKLIGKEFSVEAAANIADLKKPDQIKVLECSRERKCGLVAARRFLFARNPDHPGASSKTRIYAVDSRVFIKAETPASAVKMIVERNTEDDEQLPKPIATAVGLRAGPIKSFLPCVVCGNLLYSVKEQRNTAKGVVCAKECIGGKSE